MSKRDILSIAFKILGAVCLINALWSLPMIIASLSMMRSEVSLLAEINSILYFIGIILGPLLMFAMAFILLRYADSLSKKLIPVDEKLPVIDPVIWQKPLFVLALKIMGVFCIIKGIPKIINGLINWILTGMQQGDMFMRFIPAFGVIESVVYLTLGFYLLCGGKKLLKLAFKEEIETT